MIEIMELTESEAKVITDIRRVESGKKRKVDLSIHLLSTAAQYAKFMRDEGCGDTYSTFCDNFGYDSVVENEIGRPTIHKLVMEIIGLARVDAGVKTGEA